MKSLSVVALGDTEYDLPEQHVYDFEVFWGDDPVAAVAMYAGDPTFAHAVFSDGRTLMLDRVRGITAEAVLERFREMLK